MGSVVVSEPHDSQASRTLQLVSVIISMGLASADQFPRASPDGPRRRVKLRLPREEGSGLEVEPSSKVFRELSLTSAEPISASPTWTGFTWPSMRSELPIDAKPLAV
jgi:hypothetical protein